MGIKVCVGNWGYYNEGELRDTWFALPMDPAKITSKLVRSGLYDPMHEEIYISDYDGVPFGLDRLFTEHTPLRELNVLAAIMEELSCDDIEKIEEWCAHCDEPSSVLELVNLVKQVDDLPMYGYSFHRGDTPQKNLGYEFLNQNLELQAALEACPAASCAFDVQRYGEELENVQDLVACRNYYIDCLAEGPDLDRYGFDDFEDLYDFSDLEDEYCSLSSEEA